MILKELFFVKNCVTPEITPLITDKEMSKKLQNK